MAVRLDGDVLARIDVVRRQLETPGLKMTLSDAIKVLLARGLESWTKSGTKRLPR